MIELSDMDVDAIRVALGSARTKVGVLDEGAPLTSYKGGRRSPVYVAQGTAELNKWKTKHHTVFLFERNSLRGIGGPPGGKQTYLLVECGPEVVTIEGVGSIGIDLRIAQPEFQQKGLACLFDPRGQTRLDAGEYKLVAVAVNPTFGWYAKRGISESLLSSSCASKFCTRKLIEENRTRYVPSFAALVLETEYEAKPKKLPAR